MKTLPARTLTTCLALVLSALLFAGCDSTGDDGTGPVLGPQVTGQYVISALPTALEGAADYLLVTDTLTSGSVSAVGDGIEQNGQFRYYLVDNAGDTFFSFLYGRGDPGAVTSYELAADGTLEEVVDFQSETVHAFTNVGDEILQMQIPRDSGDPVANWFRLSTETSEIIDEGQLNTQDLLEDDNGELAYFSWLTPVDDQVWAPFFSMKGCCDDPFGTVNPGTAWIAVFSYPAMELQQIIEDERTSAIGRYFNRGLSVDENGDVYAFSSATATNNGELTSPHPSAITRINDGTTEFDEDYFFNIEEASGGDYYLTNHTYTSDGDVLLLMQPIAEKGAYTNGSRVAIANVYDQTFEWVDGLPAPERVTHVSTGGSTGGSALGYVEPDGRTVHLGISTESESHVYTIDMDSATATQGLEVEGGVIKSIKRLEHTEE